MTETSADDILELAAQRAAERKMARLGSKLATLSVSSESNDPAPPERKVDGTGRSLRFMKDLPPDDDPDCENHGGECFLTLFKADKAQKVAIKNAQWALLVFKLGHFADVRPQSALSGRLDMSDENMWLVLDHIVDVQQEDEDAFRILTATRYKVSVPPPSESTEAFLANLPQEDAFEKCCCKTGCAEAFSRRYDSLPDAALSEKGRRFINNARWALGVFKLSFKHVDQSLLGGTLRLSGDTADPNLTQALFQCIVKQEFVALTVQRLCKSSEPVIPPEVSGRLEYTEIQQMRADDDAAVLERARVLRQRALADAAGGDEPSRHAQRALDRSSAKDATILRTA